ncbi:hypothetical protein [Microbulbifer hainanensis]|uniref:hypothetical protein n=1 Tax=Microbulbifer hainanensis TaxID=2735675 RepID=UPI0018689236|nr:hypothetical protein [Microbulbifer hainanensis]
MSRRPRRPLHRYSFPLITGLFSLTTLCAGLALSTVPEDSMWRFPLLLGPIVPAAGLVIIATRYLLARDELEQRVQMIAATVSLLITVTFTLTYGLLESRAGFPSLNATWTALLILVSWIMTGNIVRRRYR